MKWETIEEVLPKLEGTSQEKWERLFEKWSNHRWHDHERPSEKTNVLLVDAGFILTDGRADLEALHQWLADRVQTTVSDLYLVSLFPYQTRQQDTAIDSRVQLFEDLGRFTDEFDLIYEMMPEAWNDSQFDLIAVTDALIERLAYGATKIRVHVESFRGMEPERVKHILKLWRTVMHTYKPNSQLIIADERVDSALIYEEEADVVCHFDLSSHVILAFAQSNVKRLADWARQVQPLRADQTYFNFLSSAERSPFEKDVLNPNPDMILAAHSVLLSLQGIPVIDYRTLFGISQPIEQEDLIRALKRDSDRLRVYEGVLSQLNVKRLHPAFSPYIGQEVLTLDRRVFAVKRKHREETLLLLTNMSEETVQTNCEGTNLFTEEWIKNVKLRPYEYVWLKLSHNGE
ncbi:hypothetical protein PJK55_08775 [Exiguobacterium sp. MMG028]|uniref:hypothetical protein n=1 Tax=Exiguobacterium sp. MMG028 TaxID=3021979 RepID=UPI0022FF2814|nr:hypothetical protein [Exiguobacterium sp. MMG028]MDA5560820.1 hypothetical protein [Exiguobacterium sp. MMG028]